jgi:hypothetical protein
MDNDGGLYGNGKEGHGRAGKINEGQLVSMEADLDKSRSDSGSGASLTVLVTAVE